LRTKDFVRPYSATIVRPWVCKVKTMTTKLALSGLLGTCAWLGVVGGVAGQVVGTAPPPVPATPAPTQPGVVVAPGAARAPQTNRPEDERAIQALLATYSRAYDAGDARTLATLFTEDAELIGENQQRIIGRPMIEAAFAALFQQRPAAVLTILPASLRFFGPDAAQGEGRTLVKNRDGYSPPARHYTALYVKQRAGWLCSSLREEPETNLTHHERLRDLEWLVGDWVDESPDSVVQTTCRWTEDQNYLLRDFTVRVQGKAVMTVQERIGWDPSTRQIKSWVFDSEGGYASGLWSRNGNDWVIKSTGIMPDGRTATATHVLTRVSPQSARWASLERTVGEQVVPDRAEYVMVRRPPQPLSLAR
jgi:uncharacterized protein (TIGR02246 family)